MKNLINLVFSALFISCACAQSPEPPKWSVALKVIGFDQQPVPNAQTWVAYGIPQSARSSNNWDKVEGVTDTNGLFDASHLDTGSYSLGIHIRKPGYYPSDIIYELGPSYDAIKWSPSFTPMLKKINNPISMYVKWVDSMPPVKDQAIGYDLVVGDWVSPHGKGRKTDIIFQYHFDRRSDSDWEYKIIISFPNPGDGIQVFKCSESEKASALHSPYQAPENGYEPQWFKTQSQRPGKSSKYEVDNDLKFFFRVRTVLDDNGNVKSANYGKIYGDFMNFRYYFNPNVNSRNVEFDPKQNLFKGAKDVQMVDP